MDTEISSARKRNRGFMTLLLSAVCEWFLMFLLFVDAALSYLLIQFARYCELETPCLLCSRLDTGFGEKKPGNYWSLFCTSHREEITSLVFCSAHGKFGDVHRMCGECLTPIAMDDDDCSPDSYRLLIGKSWVDVDRSVLQNLMLNKRTRSSPDIMSCSWCSSIGRAKSSAERLLEINASIGFGASKANIKPPLPHAPVTSRLFRRDTLKRLRDKFTGPMAQHQALRSTVGSGKRAHVGYTKLKISSGSESEFPLSDDDDGASTDYSSINVASSDCNVQCTRTRQKIAPSESEDSEKQLYQGSEVKPLTPDRPNMPDSSKCKSFDSLSSDANVEHDTRENDQVESFKKPELGSISVGFQLPDFAEGLFGASAENSTTSSPLHMPAISLLSELLSLCSVPPLSSDLTIPDQSDINEKDDALDVNHLKASEETLSDNTHFKTSQIDASSWLDTTSLRSDRNASEHAKIEEDRAELCTTELVPSSEETSQKAPNEHDDSKVGRTDTTTLVDSEGASIISELRRQIESDRNRLSSLYKELEEERNAAASAANEAMSMITRLQEEKAALHMEALQYLRMMEEQAEYDVEALEKANELLVERDKELQDLEYELEYYRDNFPNKSDGKETSSRVAEMSHGASIVLNGNCKPVSVSPNV